MGGKEHQPSIESPVIIAKFAPVPIRGQVTAIIKVTLNTFDIAVFLWANERRAKCSL